jgi:predicted GTPase
MIGETGSGKSSLINTIVNYMYGANLNNDFRYKAILDRKGIN